ncbi:unnamed protein product [Ceutorhynchus assimilis]|uniref:Uncharacterized protein n=1 Tax=Ceutorhynchus assimilis TaxID=467358 RepID=A0A9N9QN51_9CUCU|nr:unnamed protein product [Ceutorhynchus assimilis]
MDIKIKTPKQPQEVIAVMSSVTPTKDVKWIGAPRGKNVSDIEELLLMKILCLE